MTDPAALPRKIWIVCVGEPIPTDPEQPRLLRAGILARFLSARGHEVTWWNSTMDHYQKRLRANRTTTIENTECGRIILLHGGHYAKNVSVKRIMNHIRIAHEFAKYAAKLEKPDIVLVSMPPIELTHAVVSYAHMRGIPSIVDIRDLWPDIIEDSISPLLRSFCAPFIAYWNKILSHSLRKASSLIGVTQPFLEWGLAKAGRLQIPNDRVFHLAVDPSPKLQEESGELGESSTVYHDIKEVEEYCRSRDGVVGCFAGAISSRQDLPTIVKASIDLDSSYRSRLVIIICGRGDADKEIARISDNYPHIKYLGWVGAKTLNRIYEISDFSILPARPTKDYTLHYPNKLGESLKYGLPILTPLTGLSRKLLEESGLGFFYEAGNIESARHALVKIIDNHKRDISISERAKKLYNDLFDPYIIYKEYCRFIERYCL